MIIQTKNQKKTSKNVEKEIMKRSCKIIFKFIAIKSAEISLWKQQISMQASDTDCQVYTFRFWHELIGNEEDHDHLFQTCTQSRGVIHWLSEEVDLHPTYSCTARHKNGKYELLISQILELKRYIDNFDKKAYQSANYTTLRDNLNTVLGLINTQYQHYFSPESQPIITIDELFLPQSITQTSNSSQSSIKIRTNKPSLRDESYKRGKPYYQISLHREFQNLGCQISRPLKLTSLILDPRTRKCFQFNFQIRAKLQDLNKIMKQSFRYEYNQDGIQQLTFYFTIRDEHRFFREEIKFGENNPFVDRYYNYEEAFKEGNIKVPYREDQSRRNKIIQEQHYSLAFQGGGAKGLAYVGAYKALQENVKLIKKQKKQVPITSIIGSSAGGMIAMAVSTGISHRQMQKICYKMMEIPIIDSIKKQVVPEEIELELDSSEEDEHPKEGEFNPPEPQPTFEQVFDSIKQLLHEYGILHQQSFQKIKSIVSQNIGKVEKHIVETLTASQPSIGSIFKTVKPGESDESLNLEGLIVHGALMKGEAIHDIAAECLIRFLLKKYFQYSKDVIFNFLDDCFATYRATNINHPSYNNKNIAKPIVTYLERYHSIGRSILNIPMPVLRKNCRNRQFCELMTSMLNTLILLITEKEQEKESVFDAEDYKYIDISVVQSFKWSVISQIFKLKPLHEIQQIIKHNIITQEDLALIDNAKDLLRLAAVQHQANTRTQYIKLIEHEYDLRLLNSDLFNSHSETEMYQGTLQQFFQELFEGNYREYFKNPLHFSSTAVQFEENDEKLTEFELELAQIFIDACKAILKPQQHPPEVVSFLKNKKKLVKKVATINMLEYYIMTAVQLTCTSVDLDDKILRLFNKKTTPFLPVCKAVQMSGSFPCAFKALKWKKQWGKYTVFYSRYKVEVDLTGHEFTDGGLLANFPVKYLDNPDICKKYFSHIPKEGNTILLGFGLDCLQHYKPNMKEYLQQTRKQSACNENAQSFSIAGSLGYWNLFTMASTLLSEFLRQMKDDQEEKNWSDLNHSIIQKIPILRFGMKILKAYPVADRNFNISTFKNRVIHQQIYSKWKNKQALFEKEQQIISEHIIKITNILAQMKNKKYVPTSHMKEKDLSEYIDVDKDLDKLIGQCRQRAEEVRERLEIKKRVIKSISENRSEDVIKNDPWFYLKDFDLSKIIKEKVRRLIVILMMLIREAPVDMKIELSKEYIALKYPKSSGQITSPLQYDIGHSLKRMVHYLYLHINTMNLSQPQKSIKAEKLSQMLTTRGFQIFYEDAVKDDDQPQEKICFNYSNIYKVFQEITKRILARFRQQLLLNKGEKMKWEEQFILFLQQVATNEKSSKEIYIRQSFDQSFFLKNLDMTPADIKNFKENNSQSESSNKKNVFVYEAEIVYHNSKAELNQILLKQLSRKPLYYIEKYISKNSNQEIKNLINNDNKYTFIKLIRALTYYRNDKLGADIHGKGGQSRFSILERKKIEDAILSIFFGVERTKHEKFVELIQELNEIAKQQYKQIQKDVKWMGHDSKYQDVEVSTMELKMFNIITKQAPQCYFLKNLELKVLNFTISNKIISNHSQTSISQGQHYQMIQKYKHFIQDFGFIIHTLKDVVVLLSSLSVQTQHLVITYPETNGSYTYQDKLKIVEKTLYRIFQKFISRYTQLSNSPNNTLTLSTLEEIFIIEHEDIKTTILEIYSPLKYRLMELLCQRMPHEEEIKHLKFIIDMFDRINYYHPSLPLFRIQWNLILKTQPILLINHGRVNFFKSNLTKSLDFMLAHQFLESKKKKERSHFKSEKIHLIFQGIGVSNEYFCTFYKMLEEKIIKIAKYKIQQELKTESINIDLEEQPSTKKIARYPSTPLTLDNGDIFVEEEIQAITSSNYHAVFGFLLATRLPFEEIRKDTYNLRRLTNNFEDHQKISNYFNAYQWLGGSTNSYKQLLSYLQHERRQFFDEFQKIKNKDYIKNSLINEYKDIKILVNNQTSNFSEVYKKILDEISEEIQIVDGEIKPILKPKQICKKFAFNYIENLQKRVEYSYAEINKETFQSFKDAVQIIYNIFGTLLQGILCNIISGYSTITIKENNSGLIAKGIIIKRLLNAFKLKEYVMEKLKQMHLSPSITLSKFYQSAPRTLLLNFCVINITQKRLQFFNKFTTPYMPVWAAIVASASLPFVFNYFPVAREWEGVQDKRTFYGLIVDYFFKEKETNNKEITEYCSSNYISSLPIELLTNRTVNKKIGELRDLKEITISFNDIHNDGFQGLKISKKFFNLRPFISYFTKGALNSVKRSFSLTNIINKIRGKQHQQRDVNYKEYYMQSLLKVANLKNILETLVESNDNFIMQWYQDKLIRLPIKLGTLDFHQIVDSQIYKDYDVKILSEKAKQTIERSYQITKAFTSYLTCSQQMKYEQRYKVKLRLQVLYKENSNKIVNKYFKLTLLNHSKWNKNRFNNFLVYHRINLTKESEEEYDRAIDSEIQWIIESGNQLQMIFYFPYFPENNPKGFKPFRSHSVKYLPIQTDENISQNMTRTQQTIEQSNREELPCIYFTRWIFDFSEVVKSLNEYDTSGITDADSFDYIFDYRDIEGFRNLRPVSVKKMNIFHKSKNKKNLPQLRIRRLEEKQTEDLQIKKTIQKFYIKELTIFRQQL